MGTSPQLAWRYGFGTSATTSFEGWLMPPESTTSIV
jgi:hypothetical protein